MKDIVRMSKITKDCSLITAREFVGLALDDTKDIIAKVQEAEQKIQGIKEILEESLLQINNSIFEDCV